MVLGPITVTPAFAAGGLTGNVSGQVLNTTNAPINGATVALSSPSGTYTQKTDAHGRFNFLYVAIDTYVISVQAPGYLPVSRAGITVTGDITAELGVITLGQENLRTIGRVAARGLSSVFQPSQTVPQFTVSGSVLQDAQGKSANADEQAVLLAAPGFQVDKMGNLILDGGTTDEVHFFFDGVDFTDPGFNRNGNNYFFNGISNTQIVPGAGDPSQGDAGVGAVNLIVKRGTYPGTGLLDAEADTRPFTHQFNVQYGTATSNGSVSDYFSFFKLDQALQFGPFGSSAYNNGLFYNDNSYSAENDFVNNLVFRFGKGQNQSLQFLYYENTAAFTGDLSGVPIPYDNANPNSIFYVQLFDSNFGQYPFFSNSVAASLMKPEAGENAYNQFNSTQPDAVNSTSLIKLEYDNQLNATTALNIRYFNSDIIESTPETLAGTAFPNPFPLAGQTAGGSRTGEIIQLSEQANQQNLITLTGNVELARPNFGVNYGPIGLESLGPNAALFLRPPDASAPVSASNPCPVSTTVYPGACWLQQFYYKSGGTPYAPGLDLDSENLQHFWGVGLRDQVQVNSRLRLDLGLRADYIDEGFGSNAYYEDEDVQPVPGSPSTYYVANYGFVEEPHYLEPRLGASYRLGNNDSVAFTYGKSINETGSGEQASPDSFNQFAQFNNFSLLPGTPGASIPWVPFQWPLTGLTVTPSDCYPTIPFPTGANAKTPPSYSGSVGTTLQLGKPCGTLGELLYFNNDAYYPEIASVQPATFENYDFNFSHQFANGSALRIAPFFRQGTDIQVATAPVIYNPVTGVYTFGSLVNRPGGKNTTTGLDLAFTLPERPYGFTGFISATYVNEFTNTPPAGDNPYGQDFEPYVPPVSYAAGDLYRAGFVSPLTVNLGGAYKTRTGFRVNPVLHFVNGYPDNPGLLTPYLLFGPTNVPNTNITDQYGSAGAPQFIDPANPGSLRNPYISATRGTPESPSGGGQLSKPQVFGDLTFEYSPPRTRSTFGVQFLDLFNNEIYSPPTPNTTWYPVSTGVAGPLTGQSLTGVAYPTYANVVSKGIYPYGSYYVPIGVGLPFTMRLYYQLAL